MFLSGYVIEVSIMGDRASLLETSEKPVILPELSEGQETESFIPWLKEAFGCEIPTLQLHLLRS